MKPSAAALCPHHLPTPSMAVAALRARPGAVAAVAIPLLTLGAAAAVYLRRVLRDPNPVAVWASLAAWPAGLRRWWFTTLVHLANPFSRTGRVKIVEYGVGTCTAQVTEHASLRNPFRSIHAAELALLGETAAGMAFLGLLSKSQRAIVTSLHCEYLKKARGTIVAVSHAPQVFTGPAVSVLAEIRQDNADGALLATVTVNFAVSNKN
ncbi:hypothetical protein H9P43_004079 [Blastocladiella emersonii ATCC 22665]|nr:hypothetical protein H9P43_004079 [Blastocladiella emersonii ATCC 22665]